MAFNQRDLFSLKLLTKEKGNCFSHEIPFQHFIKNINKCFLNSVFVRCRLQYADKLRQLQKDKWEKIPWYLLLHIRLNGDFHASWVVIASFPSPTVGPRETEEKNEERWRKICTHHRCCSQWMLKYHSYSLYLSVQVTELKYEDCWHNGTSSSTKKKKKSGGSQPEK